MALITKPCTSCSFVCITTFVTYFSVIYEYFLIGFPPPQHIAIGSMWKSSPRSIKHFKYSFNVHTDIIVQEHFGNNQKRHRNLRAAWLVLLKMKSNVYYSEIRELLVKWTTLDQNWDEINVFIWKGLSSHITFPKKKNSDCSKIIK